MSHATATIKMHAGDSLPITVTVTDDGTADGVAIDLTGADVVFAVAHGFGGEPIFEKDSGVDGGIAITAGTGGIAVVTLEPADTEDLRGLYAYWVRAVLEDDSVITPLSGRLIVERTTAPAVP